MIRFYPIIGFVFVRDWSAEFAPAVARRVQSVIKPTFRFAGSQEREKRKRKNKSNSSERNAQRNIVNPPTEDEGKNVSGGSRTENIFPVALKNSAAFYFVINIWSDRSRFHCVRNPPKLKVRINCHRLSLRDGVNDGYNRAESECCAAPDGVIAPFLAPHLVPDCRADSECAAAKEQYGEKF